jgi:nitrate/TMAO reductase-like tetraheme cytochrome c subunit
VSAFIINPLWLHRLKRIVILLICAAVLFGAWQGVRYVRSNEFCMYCHSMLPFAKGLTMDESHVEVDCIQCHLPIEPASQYIALAKLIVRDTLATFKGYEDKRFISHVPDVNCLQTGCHEEQDWDRTWESRATNLRAFRHTPHFDRTPPEGISLHCTICHRGNSIHAQAQGERHFSVDPQNCFSCHPVKLPGHTLEEALAVSTGCLTCHPRKSLPANKPGHRNRESRDEPSGLLDEVACSGCHGHYTKLHPPVESSACLECHPDMDESEWQPRLDLHLLHVAEKRVDCSECHNPPSHVLNMTKILEQRDCVSCHEDCQTRFEIPTKIYMGKLDSLNVPDPMAMAGVACDSCHFHSSGQCSDGKASCTRCHVAGYEKLVPLWQKTVKGWLEELDKKIEDAIADGRIPEMPPAVERYRTYLHEDMSLGVHNIALTQYLLYLCAAPFQEAEIEEAAESIDPAEPGEANDSEKEDQSDEG